MPRRINLIPGAERVRTTTNVGALVLIAATVVVLFALGLLYYLWSSSLGDLREDLAYLEEERATLESQVAALSAYERLAAQRANTEAVVQKIYAGRTLVSEILDDLSMATPDNVWFTNMTLTVLDPSSGLGAAGGQAATGTLSDNVLNVEGNTYTFPDVAALLVRLKLVEALTGIDLAYAGDPLGSVDESKEVHGFSISASVHNTQPEDSPLPVSKVQVEGL